MTSSTSTPDPRDPLGPAAPEGVQGVQPAGEPGPAGDFAPPDSAYSSEGFPDSGTAAGDSSPSAGGYSQPGADYPLSPPPSDDHSTSDVAKDEASNVKDQAVDSGKHVAGIAKQEAGDVATEAGRQAKDLIQQTRTEMSDQVGQQQQRLAGTVHSLAEELGSMASGGDTSGPVNDLARQGADKGSELARWLEDHEPAELLDEIRSFARRRPVAFLAGAALAGVVVGRLTRGLAADSGHNPGAGHGSDWKPTDHRPGQFSQDSTGRRASLVDEVPTAGDYPTYSAGADDDRLAGGAGTRSDTGSGYEPYQDSPLPSTPRDDVDR